MGYEGDIVAVKKEYFKEIQKIYPNYSVHDVYMDYLIDENDDNFRWIHSPYKDIFTDFFGKDFKNGDARIIDKNSYEQFYTWLENKVKNTTLYDYVDDGYEDEEYASTLINAYRNLRNKPINFDDEFVIFEHDW